MLAYQRINCFCRLAFFISTFGTLDTRPRSFQRISIKYSEILIQKVRHHRICLCLSLPYFCTILESRKVERDISSSEASEEDPVNVSSNVVASFDAVQGKDIDPHVILWTGSSTQSPDNILAKIAPLPQVDDKREQETQNDDASAIVTKAYNTLSSSIRKCTLSGSSDVAIKIQHVKSRVLTNSPQSSWRVGSVDVTVGGQRLTAYIGTGELQKSPIEPDMGDSVQVFCHFPRLGSYFEYRCFSILSFFEKSRLAEAEAGGADSKTIKATMPCKVLKVLKKQGDEVKTGEVVVVVESMKMEITVSASADGTLESVVKEGEAVNEGSTLCKLS